MEPLDCSFDIESEGWLPDIESVEWLPDIESVEWLPDIDPLDIEPDEWLPVMESVLEDCASATPEKQALKITKEVIVLMECNMKVILRSHVARLGGASRHGNFRIGLKFRRALDRHRI